MIKKFVSLLRAAWVEYERDRARFLAIAMIYYAIVSLIPLLVLLLSALGLLVRFSPAAADVERDLLVAVEGYVGPDGLVAVHRLIDTLEQQSIVTAAISLGGLAFTSAVLFKQLRHAFRAIWRYDPVLVSGSMSTVVRTTIMEQVIAFVMVLAGGGLLLTGLALIASTRWLNHWLVSWLGDVPVLGQTVGWLVTASGALFMTTLTFWPLFKFLPPVKIQWRDAWPATMLSAISWVAAVEFLALYGSLFGSSPSAYGAIGGVLVTLLWMNTISQVLFFGAELCKVQYQARYGTG